MKTGLAKNREAAAARGGGCRSRSRARSREGTRIRGSCYQVESSGKAVVVRIASAGH